MFILTQLNSKLNISCLWFVYIYIGRLFHKLFYRIHNPKILLFFEVSHTNAQRIRFVLLDLGSVLLVLEPGFMTNYYCIIDYTKGLGYLKLFIYFVFVAKKMFENNQALLKTFA